MKIHVCNFETSGYEESSSQMLKAFDYVVEARLYCERMNNSLRVQNSHRDQYGPYQEVSRSDLGPKVHLDGKEYDVFRFGGNVVSYPVELILSSK